MRPAACTQHLVTCNAPLVTSSQLGHRYRHLASRSFHVNCRVFRNGYRPPNAIPNVKPIAAAISPHREVQAPRRRQSLPDSAPPVVKAGLGGVWKPILKALLLVPVLFLPVLFLPRAAVSESIVDIPTDQRVDVWPVTHTPHDGTISSISDSTTEPSPVSTTGVSERVSSLHGIAATPAQHHVVTELEQIAADYSLIQLAVGVAFAILLVVALRNSQLKRARSQSREAGTGGRVAPEEFANSPTEANSPARPSSPTYSVQGRKQKASRDIAAAKARQAAFASQGQSQFTDVDVTQPTGTSARPSSRGGLSSSSPTATIFLDPPAKDDTDSKGATAAAAPGSVSRKSAGWDSTDAWIAGISALPTDPTPEAFAGWDSTDAWILGGPPLPEASIGKGATAWDSTDAWTDAVPALPTDSASGETTAWDSTDAWTDSPSASPTGVAPKKSTGWDSTDAWIASTEAWTASTPAGLAPKESTGWDSTDAWIANTPADPAANKSTGWDSTDAWTASTPAIAAASKSTASTPAAPAAEKSAGWDSTDSWAGGIPAMPTDSAPVGSAGWDSTDAWTASKSSPWTAPGSTAFAPAEEAENKPLAWDSTDAWIGLKTSALAPIKTGREGGEPRARQSALGDLQKKGQQPEPGSGSATIFVDGAEERGTDSPGGTDSQTGAAKQVPQPPSGRAPAGEQDAGAKTQEQLKKKSAPPVPARLTRGQTFSKSPRLATPAYDPTAPADQDEQPGLQADEEEQDIAPPTSPQRRGQTFAMSPRLSTPAYDPNAPAELQEQPKQRKQQRGGGASDAPPPTSPQRRGQTFARSPRLATPAYDPTSPAAVQQQPEQQPSGLSSKSQQQLQDVAPATSQQQRGQTFAVSPRLSTAAFQPPYDMPQEQQPKQGPGGPPSGGSPPGGSPPAGSPPRGTQGPPKESREVLQYQQSLGNWSNWFSALQNAVTGGGTGALPDGSGSGALLDRQAQVSRRTVRAAQRMAKAQQAQQAKPRVAREVAVRQYEAVDLPGSVDEFVRARGVRGPLLLLAGLAASAAQTLEPVWPVGQQGPQGDATLDVEPVDWAQYRKYDVFHQLLKAAAESPSAQEQGYSPLQALAEAVPQSGVPKYDFLRNLLKTAAQPRGSQAADDSSKYNPLQALSRAFANFEEPTGSAVPDLDPWGNLVQRSRQGRDPSTDVGSKYDPFHQLFNAEGPAPDASGLDPLGQLLAALRQPWSRPPSSKYDVFQAIFNLEAPSPQAAPLDPLGAALRDVKQPWQAVNSKYDPVQALFTFAAHSPTGDAPLDPLPGLFRAMGQSAPQRAAAPRAASSVQRPDTRRLEKYIPLQQLFSSMAGDPPTGPTPGFDPVGSLLKSAWLKDAPRLGGRRQLPEPAEYASSDFGPAYSGRRQSAQRDKDAQLELAQLMQQRATRPQPSAGAGAAPGWQQVKEEEEEEGQWAQEALGMGRDRPSEWAGFIYNPYSGDLLPQEDEGGVAAAADVPLPEVGSGGGFGGARAGGPPGQGKPQFVSANAFRRPASRRPAIKAEAQGRRAADLAVSSMEPLSAQASHPMHAAAMLSHMGCI